MHGLPNHRDHRTALVIDVRDGVTSEFENRYGRLLESVNDDNIKVDIYTLRGNSAGSGPGLVAGRPDDVDSPDQPDQEIDLKAWAAECGYSMLLVATSVSD